MPVAARSLANLRSGGGRAGMPAKVPQSIKEMVEKALTKAGGVEYLTAQAHENPVAFMGLVGRVLPLQLAGHDGGKLEVEFRWRDETTDAASPYRAVPSVDSPGQAETSPAARTIDGDAVDVEQDETPQITFLGEC